MRVLNMRHLILAVFCALCLVPGVKAHAQSSDIKPGCDPEFMDALEARSWLLGQRRISMNQSLIYKPDSVLEYSCFDQFVGFLAYDPNTRRFSENYPVYPLWGEISAVGEESLDYALFEIVTKPLVAYLSCNFSHTFLGGRAVNAGGSPPAYGVYDCIAMEHVWKTARCSNFNENAEIDDFYDFPWYATNDPRALPIDYPACQPETTKINAAMVEEYSAEGKSHGDEWTHFVLQTENNPYLDDGVTYQEDPIQVENILKLVLPGSCSDSGVINTGIHIKIPGTQGSDFDEHFCTIPGCSYDGSACTE